MPQAVPNITDGLYCPQSQANRWYCLGADCECNEAEAVEWVQDNPGVKEPGGGCCWDDVQGEHVRVKNRGMDAQWDLLEEDPLPATLFPNATNAERRYFCYTAIAKLFGGAHSRFKIPECLEMAI